LPLSQRPRPIRASLRSDQQDGQDVSDRIFEAPIRIRPIASRVVRTEVQGRRIAVVGSSDGVARSLAAIAASRPRDRVVGVFLDRGEVTGTRFGDVPVLGTASDLVSFVSRSDLDEVIVALSPRMSTARLFRLIDTARGLPVDVRVAAADGLSADPRTDTSSMRLIDVSHRPLRGVAGWVKRAEDIVVACVALVLVAPVLALAALAIRLESPGPVLFRQSRYGFANRSIEVLKFRTMYVDQGDGTGAARTTRDDPRVTRVGRFLRRTSIDELPQLINVLRGEMSVVGPRAHALAMKVEGRLYDQAVAAYFARHRVRPGITGWAQVNGLRGEVDTLEKARLRVAFDLEYIDRWSLFFDLRIMIRTIKTMFDDPNAY
jgi:polysaccharide biosynthesis protein PslA